MKRLGEENPIYHSVVLLVKNIKKSKYFYNIVLGQKIVMDFGKNVGFEGGLAIWDREYALNQIFQKAISEVKLGGNNSEIYFEYDQLDDLFNRLQGKVTFVHSIKEQPWGQKCFRIYDPDNHIIEFAESMASVVLRLHSIGFSCEDITKKSLMPKEFIQMILKKNKLLTIKKTTKKIEKYICSICNYIYDPDLGDTISGVKAGILFGELPKEWNCPICGASKIKLKKKEAT